MCDLGQELAISTRQLTWTGLEIDLIPWIVTLGSIHMFKSKCWNIRGLEWHVEDVPANLCMWGSKVPRFEWVQ